MKQLFYIASLLTLLCCSNHPGEVRIHGEFAHLEQGEFYIYSSDNGLGRMDTLHIQDGEFDYRFSLEGTATMHILYPNFSQLTFFAASGDDIKIQGDAQNLNEVVVSGNDDNKLYTQFRQQLHDLSADSTRALARQYILQHPTRQLSSYLLTTYFMLDEKGDPRQTKEIFDSLCRACPGDAALSRMASTVNAGTLLRVGQQIPNFKLQLRTARADSLAKPKTVTYNDYKGKPLLIHFWAGWKSGSQSALYRARRLRREMNGKPLGLLSYSLDCNESLLRDIERRDSLTYASYCDHLAFASPLVQKWGIRDLPYFVLVAADGKIIAMGQDWMRDIEPHVKAIKD